MLLPSASSSLACSVSQSCPTLCNPKDCSLPGSSVHGILQARILEWVATPFSRGPFQPRDRTRVSHSAGGFFSTRSLFNLPQFSSVQSLSDIQLFVTPWTAARQAPLLLLLSVFPSIRVFSNEFSLGIRWPKYWSCSFSISPSDEYSGLISFRID